MAASDDAQRKFVVFLQNELDVADKARRMKVVQAILYLAQGGSKVIGQVNVEFCYTYRDKPKLKVLTWI